MIMTEEQKIYIAKEIKLVQKRRTKANEKRRPEFQEKMETYFKIKTEVETEKAVKSMAIINKTKGGKCGMYFWVPKSLMKNNEVPGWFLENKAQEITKGDTTVTMDLMKFDTVTMNDFQTKVGYNEKPILISQTN